MLPYSENWSEGDDRSLSVEIPGSTSLDTDDTASEGKDTNFQTKLPLWARLDSKVSTVEQDSENDLDTEQRSEPRVTISDLPLMVSEVSMLLDSIETIMDMQRSRRLSKLRPPLWIRRNWYMSAAILPPALYLFYNHTMTTEFIKKISRNLITFFHEHVVEPILGIYDELAKGTSSLSFSDREARNIGTFNG